MHTAEADNFRFERMKLADEIRREFPIDKIMRYSKILQGDDRDWSRCNLFAQVLLQAVLQWDRRRTAKNEKEKKIKSIAKIVKA